MTDLRRAEIFARMIHAKQTDKSGLPYVQHLQRVADAADTEVKKIVGWLHDSVEDCPVTVDFIRSLWGDEVADAVEAITHLPHEPLETYYRRVRADAIAHAVKLLDVNDNQSRLDSLEDAETRERLTRKYERAVEALTNGDSRV